jgi:hypothetical protein
MAVSEKRLEYLREWRLKKGMKPMPNSMPEEKVFNHALVVGFCRIKRTLSGRGSRLRWQCLCLRCLKFFEAESCHIKSGKQKSCGCLKHEGTHLMTGTAEYKTWSGMIQRCHNLNHKNYDCYGGRGITVCDRWLDSFENFLADMGPRPTGMTLDRSDNDKGYSPDNCRWATKEQQANNTRANVFIEWNGKRQTRSQWERELNMKPTTLRGRLARGWSMEKAMKPVALGNTPLPAEENV